MTTPRRALERGQDAVEFAVTVSALLLLLIGLFDMGRAVYYYSVIYNGAREGARYGTINPDDGPGIEAAVENLAVGLDISTLDVGSVHYPVTDTIKVTVTYTFTAATPLIGAFFGGGSGVALKSQATMQTEGQ